MQGVILAAGKGKRLQPLTRNRSKAMMPVLGKPIVEWVMDGLAANGVDDFVLVVHPDDRDIVRYFGQESEMQADVRFAFQAERRGMAHALGCAAPLISGDFILTACDNLVSAEHVGRMIDTWRIEPRPTAVLALMPVQLERVSSTGIVETDGRWVTRIVEKPRPEEAPSNISSLPLYLFSPRILDHVPQVGLSSRGEYELQMAIQWLIERDGGVRGVTVERRLTLTRPADLLTINRHFMTHGNVPSFFDAAALGGGSELNIPLFVERGNHLGRHCVIGPNVYVEHDCRIGDGVTLRNAVVLRRSVVPDGTRVVDRVWHDEG